MAEDNGQENFEQEYNERRDRMESLQADINSSLDYFARVPDTAGENEDQKAGVRRDMEKLRNRISDFIRELE
jgi:hypothetical protein